MAAVTASAHASAQHQTLLHFIANARWPDELRLAKVPSIKHRGPI
jgi:SRSO17 transposase